MLEKKLGMGAQTMYPRPRGYGLVQALVIIIFLSFINVGGHGCHIGYSCVQNLNYANALGILTICQITLSNLILTFCQITLNNLT